MFREKVRTNIRKLRTVSVITAASPILPGALMLTLLLIDVLTAAQAIWLYVVLGLADRILARAILARAWKKYVYDVLNEELDAPAGEPVTIFSASSCPWADPWKANLYVTDGPFLYRSETGDLFLLWSSFIKGNYAEMVVRFKNGKFGLELDHLEPLLDSDGGHGMIFSNGENAYFTYHAPNTSLQERPEFRTLEDLGDRIAIKK
jgi:hypothetical protein